MKSSLLFLCFSLLAAAAAFHAGDRVEAAPTVSTVWLPCVVTEALSGGGYRVHCTSGNQTSDWTVAPTQIRAASARMAPSAPPGAAHAPAPGAGFREGDKVDGAPFGASVGWYPCTVSNVARSGTAITGYTIECEGMTGAQKRMAIGAGPQWIRPATAETAGKAAERARAAAKAAPKAAAPAGGGGLVPLPGPAVVRPGKYECAIFSGGRLQQLPGLAREITGAGSYRDVDGRSGTFIYDPATATITFRGGALDGTRAAYQEKGVATMKLLKGASYANVDCDRN